MRFSKLFIAFGIVACASSVMGNWCAKYMTYCGHDLLDAKHKYRRQDLANIISTKTGKPLSEIYDYEVLHTRFYCWNRKDEVRYVEYCGRGNPGGRCVNQGVLNDDICEWPKQNALINSAEFEIPGSQDQESFRNADGGSVSVGSGEHEEVRIYINI